MRLLIFLSLFSIDTGDLFISWNISADYAVKFTAKKAAGTFEKLEGTIKFDPLTPSTGEIDVWVETASINTGNKTKDKHARGKKWLYAEQYPKIGFTSTSIQETAQGYQVTGNLKIRGVTQAVNLPFTFKDQVFSGSLVVNRQDYGIEGPFLFGGLVGDEIKMDLRVPVEQK